MNVLAFYKLRHNVFMFVQLLHTILVSTLYSLGPTNCVWLQYIDSNFTVSFYGGTSKTCTKHVTLATTAICISSITSRAGNMLTGIHLPLESKPLPVGCIHAYLRVVHPGITLAIRVLLNGMSKGDIYEIRQVVRVCIGAPGAPTSFLNSNYLFLCIILTPISCKFGIYYFLYYYHPSYFLYMTIRPFIFDQLFPLMFLFPSYPIFVIPHF